jgi:type I restriction enzyme S subunit
VIPSDWRDLELGDIADFKGGIGFKEELQGESSGEIPFIKVSDMNLPGNEVEIRHANNWISRDTAKRIKAPIFPPRSVVFAKVGAALMLNRRRVLTLPTVIDNNMMAAIPHEAQITSEFLYSFLRTIDLGKFVQVGAVPSVNQQHLSEIPICLPPLQEQRRIAALLDAWGEAITSYEKLTAAKELRLDWLRAKVLTGKIRLDGFEKPWQSGPISSVLTEHGQTSTGHEEVHSVSVHQGLINQIEHLGRSFAAANTDHYNRVLPGDIVYTKSPTGDFPLGIIKQSRLDKAAIVSPLYGVFTPASRELGTIMDTLFASPAAAERLLAPVVQKGAKNTIAVTNKNFLKAQLHLPTDQREIVALSELVEAARAELEVHQAELKLLRNQKRGLMQKLLTGQWRVPESIDALLPEPVAT